MLSNNPSELSPSRTSHQYRAVPKPQPIASSFEPQRPRNHPQSQYSVQCPPSPTFSNSVSLTTLLRALSSLPKQQNNLAKPLRFRGARPSYGLSLLGDELVEDGLKGMVALMKMRESRLRCRVSTRDCGDALSEYGEGFVDAVVGVWEDLVWKVVSSGESIWRWARGEVGRP